MGCTEWASPEVVTMVPFVQLKDLSLKEAVKEAAKMYPFSVDVYVRVPVCAVRSELLLCVCSVCCLDWCAVAYINAMMRQRTRTLSWS